MSIKHHFHGCQKRRWYVLRLLSGAISSTWLYLFLPFARECYRTGDVADSMTWLRWLVPGGASARNLQVCTDVTFDFTASASKTSFFTIQMLGRKTFTKLK